MSNESQEIDDAARYVELARAGWKDPAVDTFEMLAEVVDAAHADREFFAEEARIEAEEKADKQIAELRAELDIESQDTDTLLAALKVAIERECTAAAAQVRQAFVEQITQRDEKLAAQDDENALLRAEMRTLKEALAVALRTAEPTPAPDDSSPAPKLSAPRKKRS